MHVRIREKIVNIKIRCWMRMEMQAQFTAYPTWSVSKLCSWLLSPLPDLVLSLVLSWLADLALSHVLSHSSWLLEEYQPTILPGPSPSSSELREMGTLETLE